MSAGRGRTFHGPRVTSTAQVIPRKRGNLVWVLAVFFFVLCVTAASGESARGRIVLAAVQRFLLFYSGVFALIALTAAVGVGLAATDRIVMMPPGRVVAQGVHRAVSLAALAFLFIHIVTEILAHRSTVIDAFVPFMARGRTFYVGLGTIASDLLVILVVTGIARGRFATRSPWAWRAIHATAYLCWLLSLVHGLLAGRTAKPYVDWSYGVCVAAVGLALLVRLVASVRDRRETAAHPVPDRASGPLAAAMPAAASMGLLGRLTPVSPVARMPRALPAGSGSSHLTRPSQAAVGQHRTGEQPVVKHHTGEHRVIDQRTGRQRAVQDPVITGAVVQEPAASERPAYSQASQAYSQPPHPQAPYAEEYADDQYATLPMPVHPTQMMSTETVPTLGRRIRAAPTRIPRMGEALYPDGNYADPDYADASYGDDEYVDMPYPEDPYADAAYAEGAYPDDLYGAFPYRQAPPQDLWPDHPSWPRNGIVGDPSAFGPGPGAERS